MKKQGFKITAFIFTLVICIIIHPFSVIKADTVQRDGYGTFTGGRWVRTLYVDNADFDMVIDGTTHHGNTIIIYDIYFDSNKSGSFRVNASNYDRLDYFTITVNNGVISDRTNATTQTGYYTIGFTAVDHVKVILTSYSSNGYTDPTKTTTVSNFSITDAPEDVTTTLGQIDVQLGDIELSLNQILALLGHPGDTPISTYLYQIQQYSAYLQGISTDLHNIDNLIDTITWLSIPVTYKGYTTDYVNFNTDTYGYHAAGWYVLENPNFDSSVSSGIYKLTIPLGAASTTLNNLKFAQYWSGEWRYFIPDNYLYYPTRNFIIIYFTVGESYHQWPQSNYPLGIYVDKQLYKYSAYEFKLEYILQTDIEYWDLYNTMKNNQLIQKLDTLISGDPDTQTSQSIDDITDDFNLQLEDSNQSQQSINNMIEDFNLQFDLDDYKFNIGISDYVQYYKMRLTDVYDIDSFKPFFIVPIIFYMVWRLLTG